MKLTTNETAFLLDEKMRETVLQSMMKTTRYLCWKMFAIHVRTNHVHLVLQSNASKEETMGKLKQYATKDLKKYHPEFGKPMALYYDKKSYDPTDEALYECYFDVD